MSRLLRRYVRFLGTGAVGTVVDTTVLWILSDHLLRGTYWGEYIISPVLSFQCAVAVNFTISYFYVWKDRIRTSGRFFRLYIAYNLSTTAIFLLRLVVLLLIERLTSWDVLICNLLAMSFSGLLNFTISNLIIFRSRTGKNGRDVLPIL